jgi:hypothetical protein
MNGWRLSGEANHSSCEVPILQLVVPMAYAMTVRPLTTAEPYFETFGMAPTMTSAPAMASPPSPFSLGSADAENWPKSIAARPTGIVARKIFVFMDGPCRK